MERGKGVRNGAGRRGSKRASKGKETSISRDMWSPRSVVPRGVPPTPEIYAALATVEMLETMGLRVTTR